MCVQVWSESEQIPAGSERLCLIISNRMRTARAAKRMGTATNQGLFLMLIALWTSGNSVPLDIADMRLWKRRRLT
jgi:hypothetical protein